MPPAVLLGLPVHRFATFGRFDHRVRCRDLRDLRDLRDRVALVALGGDLGGRTVTGLGGPCAVVRLLGVFRLLVLLLNRGSQPRVFGRNRAARFPVLRMETPSAARFEEKFSSPWLENGKGTTNP